MFIGGLQKISLLDYPGYLAAIIFTQGCNFRCQFCYNPQLVLPISGDNFKYTGFNINNDQSQEDHLEYKEDDLFVFLKSRVDKLDAVVITGGEPTIHKDLVDFIIKIKDLGFLVKLDTNGSNPEVIKELINKKLVDYFAMDIKASKEKYQQVAGAQVDWEKIKESVKIIMTSNLPYEFKTTVVPEFFDQSDIQSIGELIAGANKWYLQKFKSNIDLVNVKLENKKSYFDQEMKELAILGKKYVKKCEAR
ncbi:MAG: anaerobic ribonucleoside-triphosphate reductase activating protein [Patescibacteria group bacterium]|nr:anaerobic ribonucleoside-triphosphate reductase activating protein [Patescibacteria group bacterium]MBU0879920.1 anaerobic ribonucleoside-triphosphate reductase activating protein [Patescibacteria group bacterium]MBU0898084.1 anaerobic ribonucleoside-triphosphate reductase activating protein [Patescibacteria group bacterium]MBU1783078.1 anaerobic ribonucleoside-triphosphate reductase activating protein [Patescibacteria group bacterium]MBU2081136.1 anaerobic ribonucleoside-triphosphate reduct